MYYDLSEEELARIQPAQLQRFLESSGWANTDEVPGKYSVYHLPANTSAEVIVPAHTAFRDYTHRMAEAVRELAEVQSRTANSVLNDILVGAMDHLVYHLDGPDVREHRIALETGVNLYQCALQALRAAAHDQITPKRFHPRMTRSEASRYLAACQIAPASPGSYVANIFCPADLEIVEGYTTTLFDVDRNFARSVTSRFLRSLDRAVEAIQQNAVDELIPLHDNENIISANFFAAIGSLGFESVATELVVSVSWSLVIQPPRDVPTRIVVQQEYLAEFTNIAARLRQRRGPETQLIIGRVAVLSGDEGETNLMQGEVLIDGDTSEGERVLVRVDLSDNDYIRACDAHKLNQRIHISGTLHRGNRLHELQNYFGFGIDSAKGSASRVKIA